MKFRKADEHLFVGFLYSPGPRNDRSPLDRIWNLLLVPHLPNDNSGFGIYAADQHATFHDLHPNWYFYFASKRPGNISSLKLS